MKIIVMKKIKDYGSAAYKCYLRRYVAENTASSLCNKEF
jgi:hypothetical protein